MLMPIRAVIFDFGDVLLRTEDPSGRRKWEKYLGLPQGELSRLVFESDVADLSMVGKATEADVWKHVAATFSLNDDQLRELQHDFWSGDRIDARLVEFLRDLRPRYRTAILSNAWPGARAVFTQTLGLGDVVDEMIISAEEGVAKPDTRIYRIAVRRLGVQTEETLFIDDLAENVRGAQAVGMRGVQFTSTEQTITAVKKYLGFLIQGGKQWNFQN
jgi:epoxide hydrolase-like predicted phosphatase